MKAKSCGRNARRNDLAPLMVGSAADGIPMDRAVETCPYRIRLPGSTATAMARCNAVAAFLAGQDIDVPLSRTVCDACCQLPLPNPGDYNDVIASIVFTAAQHLRQAGADRDRSGAAARIQREAVEHLKIVWATPNSPRWTGPGYNLRSNAELIDAGVSADTFASHLQRSEPFGYLRYGDGEWLSILGQTGRTSDGHDYFPDSLRPALQQSLVYTASLGRDNQRLYTGLHIFWFQDAIRRYLLEHGLAYAIHWVGDSLFEQGLRSFATRRFFEAVRAFNGIKILVGNPTLVPIAAALGCRHLVIPLVDCYLVLHDLLPACRFPGAGLVLSCAGMASECLLSALHQANPLGTYIDCGHIFDALVGRRSRAYTEANSDGILEFLEEHYAPLFRNDYRA